MSDTSTATATLRPGDPPPFWDGLWHPEGKTEGAIMVKPLMPGQARAATAPAAAAAAAGPAIAMPPPPEVPAAPAVPEATAAVPEAPPAAEPAAAPKPQPETPPVINLGPPPAPEPAAQPAPPRQPQTPPAGAPARSFVLTVAARGPLAAATGAPQNPDPAGSEALRAKAKELQAAGQLGPALQALSEALNRAPGEAATYAQMGQALLAGRAWEDAAHHFLVAYMLSPREPAYGRMTLHAAFVLGYVGWSFQIAQSLYKAQPTPDLAEMGRQAHGWLQSRAPAVTALCPACRTTTILPAPGGPCPKCGGTPMGAPANAVGFAGLKLLQQTPPAGRLFAGAACVTCKQDTVLVVAKGGPRCQSCQGPAVAGM